MFFQRVQDFSLQSQSFSRESKIFSLQSHATADGLQMTNRSKASKVQRPSEVPQDPVELRLEELTMVRRKARARVILG